MPKRIPLLSDSKFPQSPPCPRCGLPTIMLRMTPQAEAGRFVRSFECPNCEATFETTDESDAEIEALAERMVRGRSRL